MALSMYCAVEPFENPNPASHRSQSTVRLVSFDLTTSSLAFKSMRIVSTSMHKKITKLTYPHNFKSERAPKLEKPLARAVKPCSGSRRGRKNTKRTSPTRSKTFQGREQNILKKHAVCANEASFINQSPLSAILSIEHPSNLDVQYCTRASLISGQS
jgi:hypothetical protein